MIPHWAENHSQEHLEDLRREARLPRPARPEPSLPPLRRWRRRVARALLALAARLEPEAPAASPRPS